MHLLMVVTTLVVAVGGCYFFILRGEVLESLGMFWIWFKPRAWKQLRKVRHVRRLLNFPFRHYLSRRTRLMPFCYGQVWVGKGGSMRIVGRAENGDWLADIGNTVTLMATTKGLRNRIEMYSMYLYEFDHQIEFVTPESFVGGSKVFPFPKLNVVEPGPEINPHFLTGKILF